MILAREHVYMFTMLSQIMAATLGCVFYVAGNLNSQSIYVLIGAWIIILFFKN